MRLTRAMLALVLAVLAFVVVSTIVSTILTALAIVRAIVTTVVTLAVLGAVVYSVYRLYRWLSGDSTDSQSRDLEYSFDSAPTSSRQSTPEDRVDDLQQRYANGELSEAELERRLERELTEEKLDSIDRELQREL